MEFDAAAIGRFALWYVAFLLSLTVHEGAHALAAWIGGDDTAYRGGQVSLNPFPHLRREPFGAILVPILSFFGSGWMMGWASTPFDPLWAARHPRRQALMSLAGPAANFSLAALAFLSLRLLLSGGILALPDRITFSWVAAPPPGTPGDSPLVALAMFLSIALNLNVLLGLFNLIPLPPLDGAGVAEGLLPGRLAAAIGLLRANPMLSILGLLVSWRVFGGLAGPALVAVIRLLHPGALS
jgi:Zn-dependent protease